MDSFAKHPYIFLRKDGYYIDIPKNITTLAEGSFIGANITTVIVPDNITTIGKEAFRGCSNLKTITVKSKVLKKVGKNAFKGISKKAIVTIPKAKQKKLFGKLKTKVKK